MSSYSISRRDLSKLGMAGLAAGMVGSRFTGPASAQDAITLQWWDHYAPLEELLNGIFDAYNQEHPNVTVERTLYNLPELGQSLQLAFNSGQAPDVHAIASLNIPIARLVQDGWFTPIDDYVSAEFKARFPEGALLEGLHTFGGKLYSFPMFSFRSHSTTNWFNTQLVEDAGLDPDNPATTWDEFRAAAKAVTDNGGGQVFGWIQAIGLPERLGTQVAELAQTAGAPGVIDWTTGEYVYHSEPFMQAVDFLMSLNADGSLMPGSTSLDARNARANFAAGAAAFNFDGPWQVGVIAGSFPEFAEFLGVSQIPIPTAGEAVYISKGPNGGDFWVNSQSEHPDVAAQILEAFNTPEFYVGLAERQDQPPLDLAAVESASVHPAYAKALGLYGDVIRLAPVPEIKNPNVSEVNARLTDIRPNFGEILQGLLSGDITDAQATLEDYSSKLNADRARAIDEAVAAGVEVSADDWVFPNWDKSQDYTSDKYAK